MYLSYCFNIPHQVYPATYYVTWSRKMQFCWSKLQSTVNRNPIQSHFSSVWQHGEGPENCSFRYLTFFSCIQGLNHSVGFHQWTTCMQNKPQCHSSIHPYTTSTSHRMRVDNWREGICMRNSVDIYLNLISFPHCRLLCQSHINPLISYYAVHDVAHAWWIFIRMAFSPLCFRPSLSLPYGRYGGIPEDPSSFPVVLPSTSRLAPCTFCVARCRWLDGT